MAPSLFIFSLARKAYNYRKSKKDGTDMHKPRTPMSPIGKLRLFAALPVTITAIAFLLSFLCVFAGSRPGMMDDYAIFTLNMSRIGENILQDVDSNISSAHLKRSEPADAPMAMITPAPTILLVLPARRNVPSDISHLTSELGGVAHSAGSAARSKATAVQSNVANEINSAEAAARSKASSIEIAASSKANSALDAFKTNLVQIVNKAYHGAIDELDLQDFYALHISSSCIGTYTDKSGKNMTVGNDALPNNGTKLHVDSCEAHSAVNPLQVIRIIYWIGVVLTGTGLCLGVYGIIRPNTKTALLNIFGTLPAFFFLGLASAVTHGVASGASHLINFVGEHIGISGAAGQKFLQLTWTTVVLLMVNMAFWALLWFFIRRAAKRAGGEVAGTGFGFGRKRADRTSAIAMGPMGSQRDSYETDARSATGPGGQPYISSPMPVHSGRGYDGFI